MKQVLEEALEQIKGPKQQKPQAKTTGLKDQLDPGKAVAAAMKQALGFGGDKPVPTPQELEKTKQEKVKEEDEQIRKVRANIELLKPPKPQQQEVPEYIKGKPGYDPEKQASKEQQMKYKMPQLVQPSTKPRRGNLFGIARKQRGIEDKSGYQG